MEENDITKKPKEGTWDEMQPSSERKPKVEFEMNKSVKVSFKPDFTKPFEYTSQVDKESVYYLFNCTQDEEEKVFLTSAWSLLKGLKDLEPLANKTVLITKDMKDGKQHYSVEEVNKDDVEVVKVGENEVTEKTDEDYLAKKVKFYDKVGAPWFGKKEYLNPICLYLYWIH